MRTRACFLFVAWLAGAVPAAAQSPPPARQGIRLDLPAFDAPYNATNGGRAPSMGQSLALGVDFYEVSNDLIDRVWKGRRWPARLSFAGWYLFSTVVVPLPGSEAWLHEEYHRAVMGRRGISSFNDVYAFGPHTYGLYVSHVTDEDLIRLKRDHPAEQVRMSAAGLEGEYQLVRTMERDRFFRQSSQWQLPVYLGAKLASLGYVWSSHLNIVDEQLSQANSVERQDIAIRDFTGHDVTAWVYDLHRPDEPYTARGFHLLGVGIDRYIKPSSLTPAELRYVTLQGRLQLINLLDPSLVRSRGFTMTSPINHRPMQVTARGGHVLTPFGYSIDADVMLRQDRIGLVVGLHTYVNQHRTLPGIDAGLVDYPIGKTLTVSPRLAFWVQPTAQRFDSLTSRAGGLIGCRFDKDIAHNIGAYVDLEAKTAGWVAGNAYLDANASVKLGMTIRMR